jgi:tRNA dimethylallyltransferase
MKLVVVVGPTASGKTALALRLAEVAGGEIVSADSQQVYRGMDIGTGKASAEERARVRHHLLDVVDPDDTMTAARFAGLADQVLSSLRVPGIVAGGTGLYVRALLEGLFEGPGADAALRERLATEPTETLRERLATVDPETHARLLPGDRLRFIRALEVHALTGRPISAWQAEHRAARKPRFDTRIVALAPPRPELVARIEARVDQMMAAGFLDEVRALHAAGYGDTRALGAIGYRELGAHLRGEMSLDAAISQVKQATRRYARRQVGWWRPDPGVAWYTSAAEVKVAELAAWLRQP